MNTADQECGQISYLEVKTFHSNAFNVTLFGFGIIFPIFLFV
jgi:hypothetical protein